MIAADLPVLSRDEIRRSLETLLAKKRNRYLFAFWGRGNGEKLEVGPHSYEVVPVESELDLRLRLPELDEIDPRRVYLVPFTELPRDVVGLFALGRVERVGKGERLAAILGAREVDTAITRTPLGELLLRGQTSIRAGSAGDLVTGRALVQAWMSEHWELPTGADFGRDALLAWAASSAGGRTFTEQYGANGPLTSQIEDEIRKAAGYVGRLAFHAWRTGQGESLIELAILAEAGRSLADGPFTYWLRYELKGLGIDEHDTGLAASELAGALSTAMTFLERRTSAGFVRARVDSADRRLADPPARGQLREVRGERLALHHEGQTEALAAQLEEIATLLQSSPDDGGLNLRARLREATTAFHAWRRHELSRRSDVLVERAHDALRLAIFLDVQRRDERLREDPMSPDLPRLSRWYVDQGGYVDRARVAARGPDADRLGRAIGRVVKLADARRLEIDRRFARGLVEWCEAGRPRREVIGIEDALAHIAKPFLEASEDRRLLVILLDGMSWSEGSEILDALAQHDDGWGPLYFNAKRSPESELPVVLAALPTVTDVSRSAFFLGKRVESGIEHSTQKDPERLRANKALAPFFPGTRAPRLFLRADAQTKAGTLANEVLTEIADLEARLVAVVLNTIDDSLKGNPSQRQRWDLTSIAPLRDLLSAARKAGRYVMLASDHGHVKSAGLESLDGLTKGEGRRWRALQRGKTAIGAHEVSVAGNAVWVPKGADGVVLLADETGRYGASPASGEHGGASLTEVITPCLIVGWDEPAHASARDSGAARGAEDLRLQPRYSPAWYRLRIEDELVQRPEKPRRKDSRQLELATSRPSERPASPVPSPTPGSTAVAPPPVPPAGATITAPPTEAPVLEVETSKLARSALFKAQVTDVKERHEVLRALAILKARGGRVPADVFAQEMKYLPHRAASVVAALGEKLALDGMQPLRFDRGSGQVVLELALFKQLYGEEP